MKNVLIDQNCKWLAKAESRELLKEYDSLFVVGEDMKQRSFDENCASFCVDKNCDFLTADNTAYTHFFRVKSITSVQISEFTFEKGADRHIYLIRIMD